MSDRVHLGFAGRFIALKGHKLLIEATAQALAAGAPIHLHLAGDGPLLEDVKSQVCQAGIGENVTIHGRIPRASMSAFYQNLDIYVSPSYFEGLPVTFLEAMASGLPIISTRIDATQGVISAKTGILTEVGSAPELARAMIALAGRPEQRISLGRHAREEAETKYNWDTIAADQVAIYARYLAATPDRHLV
ncbi:MAG: glycosyltransferase family 4 protein [Anaerolineales bacterium]|nr:glycosyltransferase family 4 protein [Anaerolineales bacterium]